MTGWLGAPVSDRHRPPEAGERVAAAPTDGATPSASAVRPEVAACRRGPGGPLCRSETGVPSQRAVRSREVPAPPGIFIPCGMRSRTRVCAFLPVGPSDRRSWPSSSPCVVHSHSNWPLVGTARRRRANACLVHARFARRRVPAPSGPGAVRGCGPSGPRAGQRPALQACTPSSRVRFRRRQAFSCPTGYTAGRA